MTTANADCISSHIFGTCKPQFMPSTLPSLLFSRVMSLGKGVWNSEAKSSGEAKRLLQAILGGAS